MNQNKTRTVVTVLVVVIFIIGIVAVFAGSKKEVLAPTQTSTATTTTTTTITTTTTTSVKSYNMAEVATHSSATNCWSAVNGNVYDLTTWIGKHPGGEKAILSICGKDGSEAFNGKHGGQDKPENTLASFLIGVLAK